MRNLEIGGAGAQHGGDLQALGEVGDLLGAGDIGQEGSGLFGRAQRAESFEKATFLARCQLLVLRGHVALLPAPLLLNFARSLSKHFITLKCQQESGWHESHPNAGF